MLIREVWFALFLEWFSILWTGNGNEIIKFWFETNQISLLFIRSNVSRLFSDDALPKIKWSTIRAMSYSTKFWGSSLSTLQLYGWLGRVLYPCCILAFLDWSFNKIRESFTVTDRAAYWMAPSNPSHIQPQKIKDIDFRAPKRKKRRILHCAQEDQQLDKSKEKKEKNVK